MLLEFSCSNHKSITEKITFSFLAGQDKRFSDKQIKAGNFNLLRSAVIYGANASGKTNTIDAIGFMKAMVMSSFFNQPGAPLPQPFHKPDGAAIPSIYEAHFIKDETRFSYSFAILAGKVTQELLLHYPKGRAAKIFERKGDKITIGRAFKESLKNSLGAAKENRLFLSCAANLSAEATAVKAFRFFADDIFIIIDRTQDLSHNLWLLYALKKINNDAQIKEEVLSQLHKMGINIKNFIINIKTTTTPEGKPQEQITALADYESYTTDLLAEESAGTLRLITILVPMHDIVQNNKILIYDELDASLHENLFHNIIKQFIELEKTSSQLLFTAHSTSILTQELFRRDQIWLTELRPDLSTDLYSLAEIKDVRKDENIRIGYLRGHYGAVPAL